MQHEEAPSMDIQEAEQRRWRRYPADWAAKLTLEGGASANVRVVDSGVGGLGLKYCPPLEIGQVIDVTLADIGSFPCSVVWQEGDRCGVEFVELIESADEYSKFFLSGPLAKDSGIGVAPSSSARPREEPDAILSEASRYLTQDQKPVQPQFSRADLDFLARSLHDLSRDLQCCQDVVRRLAENFLTRSGHDR